MFSMNNLYEYNYKSFEDLKQVFDQLAVHMKDSTSCSLTFLPYKPPSSTTIACPCTH
jgi:hypothetical protein